MSLKIVCEPSEHSPFYIYEPQQVFELAISKGHEWVKSYMYMHSVDENTHAFKCPVTRKYKELKLN